MQKLTLEVLPHTYAVCRLDPNGPIPNWALMGDDFISLTRTRSELSVVCLQENVPVESVLAERGWRCIKVEGKFDFSVSGLHILLANPLAESSISVLAIATYETDHVLVKEHDFERTIQVLTRAGHEVKQ
jgi:hypothetical protein